MIIAGVDIGSMTAKAVLMDGDEMLAYSIILTGAESGKTALKVVNQALEKIGLPFSAIQYTVATGYGRVVVPFAQANVSEISCHARGAHSIFPSIRTILDIGGQDCKAIRCNADGKVKGFVMNDKCAAGTGRFLEITAEVLGLPLEAIGNLSLQAKKEVPISTTCLVFAKSEILSLMHRGVPKQDILGGLNESIGNRVFALLRKVGIERDFMITGGIAKNIGMVKKIEQKLSLKALLAEDPQMVGALGAAIFAKDKLAKS